MKKILAVLFMMLVSVSALACPYCQGAAKKPPYTLYIIGGFVLLTYVPFYLLFRSAKKYDPKNFVIND
ncbi:MAG: hypothetical protein K2P81_03465 [Bacteriovoracaceae bacterium]|nr:hypothetical protein [Bacteriovoracaceae bacterium]